MKKYYVKTKRELESYCNICGSFGKMTWDHVPPKHCNNHFPTKLNGYFSEWTGKEIVPREAQSGIQFRTICEQCNGGLLGGLYDRSMIAFSEEVENFITSDIELPDVVHIDVKINKLCRAVCGHFLSSLVYYDTENVIDVALREYFLDSSALPPQNMKLLYWMYLYNTVAIQRNILLHGRSTIVEFPDGLTSTLATYPIAYVLHNGLNTCGLLNLFSYCTNDIDDIVKIPIDFRSAYYPGTSHLRHPKWPGNVGDSEESALFAMTSQYYMESSLFGVRP